MMRPKELRIGNYFYLIDRTQEIHIPIQFTQEVVALGFRKAEFVNAGDNPAIYKKLFECEYSDMSEITLTEEWLIKFGFKKTNKSYHMYENSAWQTIRNMRKDEFFYKGTHIKYVHQLQNLYFALTGKEL